MSDISPSRLGESFDAEFERQIANASTAEEIKRLMRDRALSEQIVVPDPFDANVLHEVPAGTVQRQVGKTLVINGVKHTLIADDEASLLRQESELYKKLFADAQETEHVEETLRDERGRFSTRETPDINAQPDLDRIQADLVAKSLREQGIDPEALREFSENRISQSWQQATSEFLNSEAGSWWPGTAANVSAMGDALQELGLAANPSVESLRKAAEYLRDSDRLAENPELTQRQKIAEANSVEDIKAALGRDRSSLFGSR